MLQPSDSIPRGPEQRPAASTRADGRVRLLVVEDNPDQQELITEALEDHFGAGCCEVVGTCQAALAAELTAFDLVLCDVNLPDGNGLDLLLALRQRADVPVMLLTGENDSDIATQAIRRGATDYVVKAGAYLQTIPVTVDKNIAAALVARHRQYAAENLRQRNFELERNLRLVEKLAATDPMTGCYNRRAFEKVLQQLFAQAYRTGEHLACVMIDLDNFKLVNDVHGHTTGDSLVRLAAACIRANLRQMDVACRYGGDEFILLIPGADAAGAAIVADRIRREYGQASARVLESKPLTMSIGVGSLLETSPRPSSPEALIVAADRALYQAKDHGRNQICATG